MPAQNRLLAPLALDPLFDCQKPPLPGLRSRGRSTPKGLGERPGGRTCVSAHAALSEPASAAAKMEECECSHAWNLSVANGVQSVHPMGQPIRASTNCGLRTTGLEVGLPACAIVSARRPAEACTFRASELRCSCDGAALFLASFVVGVDQVHADCAAALGSIRSPELPRWFGPPFEPSVALAVGQCLAAPSRVVPPVCPGVGFHATCAPLCTVGVGHDSANSSGFGTVFRANLSVRALKLFVGVPKCENEDPLSLVRRPHIERSEAVPFRIEPEIGQVSENNVESSGNKGANVLHEDEARTHLGNDASHLAPEAGALAHDSDSLPCIADVLAREAARDDIHEAAPGFAVEGANIVPDREQG